MKFFKKNLNILGKEPPKNEIEFISQLIELNELKLKNTCKFFTEYEQGKISQNELILKCFENPTIIHFDSKTIANALKNK